MAQDLKQRAVFEQLSVPKAVMSLAVPSVITQLINIIYNFADTYFVGRTNNPAMVAAVSVSMPVFLIMGALANLFGIGGSAVISRSLGMKKPERARHTFAFCFYGGLAAAVVYALVILLFRARFIPVIGGTPESSGYVSQYMFWTMVVGAIPSLGNFLCAHLVRATGASKEAGFGASMGGILNIALDPLFMFVILPPGNELLGAALATFLSSTVSLLYFLVYLVRHRGNPVYTMDPRQISLRDRIPADVLSVGVPAALSTTLAMVSNMFANALVKMFGNAAVAGMGVTKKIYMLSFNTNLGLSMGVLPLIGYTYGARNYSRMKRSILFTAVCAFTVGVVCFFLFRGFSSELVAFFIREEGAHAYGVMFLRIIAFASLVTPFTFVLQMVFQATGRRIPALILPILRHGSVDILFMFLLRQTFGAAGVQAATPVAETIAFALAVVLFLMFLRQIRRLAAEKEREAVKNE